MVRLTASRGKSGNSSRALGVRLRANSWYASSITTIPGVASQIARIVSRSMAVPVGLLGLAMIDHVGSQLADRDAGQVDVDAGSRVGGPGST